MTDAWAKDSGHWYKADGTPFYTMKGANGQERNTTLRDARKLGLFPSCTGVIKEAAAPGLERYKLNQMLMAALTITRLPDEPEEAFLKRIWSDAKEHGRAAADRGSIIHGQVERFYRGDVVANEWTPWARAVSDTVFAETGFQQWQAERSYAHVPLGFGCRIDLHSDDWVIDFKSKEDALVAEIYDEHVMQLGACRVAALRPAARCAVVFIDRNKPLAVFNEVKESELVRGMGMFKCLLEYYQTKTGHRP